MVQFFFDRVANIVGKWENSGFQHFLIFPQCFRKAFFWGSFKVGIVWERVNSLPSSKFLCLFKFKFLQQTTTTTNKRAMMALESLTWCRNIKKKRIQTFLEKEKKHSWTRRNCYLQAFSPFSKIILYTFLVKNFVVWQKVITYCTENLIPVTIHSTKYCHTYSRLYIP